MILTRASTTSGRFAVRSARAAWLLVGAGAVGAACYILAPESVGTVAFLVIPVASIAGSITGALRNQVRGARRPWILLTCALVAFFAGALIRATLPGAGSSPPTAVSLIPDAFVVPGYALLVYALLEMLRLRRASADDPARADALLIGTGAGLLLWGFLIAPGIWSTAEPSLPRVISGLLPAVDVLILVIVTYLITADGTRAPALCLLSTAGSTVFVVDLIYTISELGIDSASRLLPIFDALCLFGYAVFGAAALHPSMRTLTEPQQVFAPRRPGVTRTAALAIALAVPTIVATIRPSQNTANATIRVLLTILITTMIIYRFRGVTDSWQQAEQNASWRATHDPLTRLPNRELLTETIDQWGEQARSNGKNVSLLFIDLDHFKSINDMWGHHVGDELLCAVAGRLGSMVRTDDLVCRIGADEFIIAMASDASSALASSLAERLVDRFEEPFLLSTASIRVTPSIGIATSSDEIDSIALIRDADTAMYQAKASGRNTIASYDTSFRESIQKRVELDQAFRGALERGELSVHYHPLIDLQKDLLTGFEALMRWTNPKLGKVSPAEFIPIAEESGLIVPSGTWLLKQAAAQLAEWRSISPAPESPLHVSVNIAVRQLHCTNLVDIVWETLDETGLPASALWLEVTESNAMEDPDKALKVLRKLRDMGITVCIDDFGTGHSSLSYLTSLPAQIVKIDRSLVRDLGTGGPYEEIVHSVITMVHGLGRQVVAEGVETQTQRGWLSEVGCDMVQGFLYGPPKAAEAQASWFDASARRPLLASAVAELVH